MTKLRVGLAATLLAVAVCVPQLLSQEKKAADAAKPEAKKEVKGRLPNNYGKLDLTEDQKTRIYAVQAKYGPDIEKLQKQLNELKARTSSEIEAVLTAEQKTKLAEVVAAARKKAADDKKPAAKPAETKAEPAKPAGK